MSTSLDLVGLIGERESTYATDPAPTTSDGIRLSSKTDAWLMLSPEYQFPNQRDEAVSGSLLPVAPGAPEGRMATFGFGWEMRGGGSTYTAVEDLGAIGKAIEACGFTETYATNVLTFTLGDQTPASMTFWAYAGTKLYKITGCRGNLEWTCPAGQITTLQFTFQGVVRQAVANSALASITYNTQIPPAFVSASATLNDGSSFSPDLVEASFNAGNEVVVNPSANPADGIAEVAIARSRPIVTVRTKERDISSGFNPYTAFDAATATAIDWTVGATQYNRADLAVTAGYLAGLPHEDQEGFAGWGLEYRCIDAAIVFD